VSVKTAETAETDDQQQCRLTPHSNPTFGRKERLNEMVRATGTTAARHHWLAEHSPYAVHRSDDPIETYAG